MKIHEFKNTMSSIAHRSLRHLTNLFLWRRFGTERHLKRLPHLIMTHDLPIYRKLAGVDPSLFEQKRTNLEIAISSLGGVVIAPNEIFSLWRMVGKPSGRHGFKEGLSICRGQPSKSIGGGLCQLANAIFWLALHSDMTVIERHRHSLDLFPDDNRRIPFGTGATIVYNYKDIRLLNTTPLSYQLCFKLTDTMMTAELRVSDHIKHTYRLVEEDHQFIKLDEGWFRSNTIIRERHDKDRHTVSRETLFNNFCRCQYTPMEVL